jgi:hypothetical protein
MADKLIKLAKSTIELSSGKLMIGPNERARSQYPSAGGGSISVKGGGGWGGRW